MSLQVTAKVETRGKKKFLIVEAEMCEPTDSASGKTKIVASTGGNKPMAGCEVNGQVVVVGLNAYIKP